MFYHWTDFNDFMSDDQAMLVVKRLNEISLKRGQTLTGIVDEKGNAFEFSSEIKPTDTHVGFLQGIAPMEAKTPLQNPVKIDLPTDADMMRALQEHNSYLQKQVNTYKGGLK